MKVRFKTYYGPYRLGDVRDFPDDRARLFIQAGQAEEWTAEKDAALKKANAANAPKPPAPPPPPAPPAAGQGDKDKDPKDPKTKAPGGPPVDKMERGPGDGRTVTK